MPLPLYGDTPRPAITTRRVEGTNDLWLVDVHDRQIDQHFVSFQRVVRPERRVPSVVFGIDTGLTVVEPAVLEPLDVEVELWDGKVWFDSDALAAVYGRDIFGAERLPLPSASSPIVPLTPEERRLDHNLREFLHATPDEIAIAIQQLRNEEADGELFIRALRERGASEDRAQRIRRRVIFERSTRPYVPPIAGPLVDIFPDLPTTQGRRSIHAAPGALDDSTNLALNERSYRNAAQQLIDDIRLIDSDYQSPSLRVRNLSVRDRAAHLDALRLERAARLWQTRQEIEPLQIELLRFAQRRVELAYVESEARYEAGELRGANRNLAIGTDVDRTLRQEFRDLLTSLGLSEDNVISVNRDIRTIDGGKTRPDLRVADIFIEITIDDKDEDTEQVRTFFEALPPPTYVIIVKPRQVDRTLLVTPPQRRYARDR